MNELLEKLSKLEELQNLMGKAIEKAMKACEEAQKELTRPLNEKKEKENL